MDVETLGASLAIVMGIPNTAAARAETAAEQAESAAQSISQATESIQEFKDTGLSMINGKLCVKVERS